MKKTVRRLLCAGVLLSILCMTGCGEVGDAMFGVSLPETERYTGTTPAFMPQTEPVQFSTQASYTTTTTASTTTTPATTTTSATTTTATTTTTSATTASTAAPTAVTTVSTGTTDAVTTNSYGGYALSDSDQALLKSCVFVGDSICHGLEAYKILPDNNVLAAGNIGVRSIMDYQFKVSGKNYNVVQALAVLKPKYVIFSMGMNDINMTSSAKYCENYKKLLTQVQQVLPNAVLCVASITPISNDSTFSTNKKIDSYNKAISDYLTNNYPGWHYLDLTKRLKNQWNGLYVSYSSGDGIHLSPAAYSAYLYQVCEQLR